VVFPADTAQVAGVLRVAAELGVPVVPRGAGSNLSAGTVAHRGGIMLTLTRMDRLLELDLDDLVAVAEPGVPTARIAAAAAEHGLLYPPDPGSRTTSTIGGNVGENAAACGAEVRRHARLRHGLEAVLGTGEVIRAAASSSRTSPATTSCDCLCGSEGTLAVITEADAEARAQPAARASAWRTSRRWRRPAAQCRGPARRRAARDARVPRRDLHRDGRGLRRDRPAPRRGRVLIFGQDGGPEPSSATSRGSPRPCEPRGDRGDVGPPTTARRADPRGRRAALPRCSRLGTA
jgi:glycolate oxidase